MTQRERIGHEGIIKNIGKKTIDILLISRSACASCHAKGMCGMADMAVKTITAQRPDFPVEHGQKVVVYARIEDALFSVLVAYVFPAILIIALIAWLTLTGEDELLAALVALGGVVFYYVLLYLFRKKIGKRIKFTVERFREGEI